MNKKQGQQRNARRHWLAATLCMLIMSALWLVSVAQAQPADATQQRRAQQVREQLLRSVDIHKDLVYATVDGKELKLDLYVPKQKAPAGQVRPLVVWVHGGGWKGGSKEHNPALFLLMDGYAVASINYRLTGVASFPAQIWDCKAAIRFLRAKAHDYGYDPSNIGVFGGSAGGHLAALMGTTNNHPELEGKVGDHLEVSSNVQAVVGWYGPTDLAVEYFNGKPFPKERITPMDPARILDTAPYKGPDSNELTDLLAGPPIRVMERALLASPIHHVSQYDTPFLIMHGERDNVVPVYQSRRFVEKLREFNVPVEYVEIPNAGHGGAQFFEPEQLRRIQQFFNRHLRNKPDPGQTTGKPQGTLPPRY
jgi:acetyl esterase/lipase